MEITRASVLVTEILVVLNVDLSSNATKEWEILGHWLGNLWPIELGLYRSNVYGKISAAL